MAPQPLDELGISDHDPRLRPAEELVPGEADEVGTGLEALANRRLLAQQSTVRRGQRAGAEVVDQRQVVPLRDLRQLGDGRKLREADEPEVRLVHPQEQRRLGPDRTLVVRGASPVRRPDLDEPRARARQHVRDPEAVADLDQLAARDEHLPSLGERGQGEQDSGRVVVHDEHSLRARQTSEDPRHVILPRAARARAQVVLEVRVAAPDLVDALESRLRQRCAPQVRVHDHARRVQGAPQPGRTGRRELRAKSFGKVSRVRARVYVLARAREDGPCRLDGERVVAPSRELVNRGQVAQPHRASAFSSVRNSVRSS